MIEMFLRRNNLCVLKFKRLFCNINNNGKLENLEKPNHKILLKNIIKSVSLLLIIGGSGFLVGKLRREQVDSVQNDLSTNNLPFSTFFESLNKEKNNNVIKNDVDVLDLDPQGIITEKVYFDVSINNQPPSRIIIGLYGYDYPKLVKQFGDLCDSMGNYNKETNKSFTYQNSKFMKILPGLFCQGGYKIQQITPTNEIIKHYSLEQELIHENNENNENNNSKTMNQFKHTKYGVVSTSLNELLTYKDENKLMDFNITFGSVPIFDRESTTYNNTNNYRMTIIGQVMYNGNNILQSIESCGSITGKVKDMNDINVVACGRLTKLSKAIEVNNHEILDKNGKNINQIIK